MTHHFVDRGAQFVDLNASQTFVNDFAFRVVKKRSRQGATPLWIYHIDGRFRIGKIQQVNRHLRMHLAQKSGHARLDVRQIVQSNRDKIETFGTVVRIKFYEVGKFIATRIAPGGPIVNQQRSRIVALEQSLQTGGINRDYGGRWLRRPALSLCPKAETLESRMASAAASKTS